MDTIIDKKRFSNKRIGIISASAILIVALVISLSAFDLFTFSVKADRLTIKEVDFGTFEDVISASATVEPINTFLVNVIEGGTVQEVFVEDGQMVDKGQQLARIANPNVALQYMTQETSIIEQINNLRNTRLVIENNRRELQDKLYLQERDFFEADRQYKMDTMLFRKGVIARNDYYKSVDNYNYHKKRTDLIKISVERELKDRELQIERLNTSINLMERNLDILRLNKNNFIVKAPISGRLSSFNPIIGQSFSTGQSVGKIDVMSGFMVRSMVNEFYLKSVSQGLKAFVIVDNQRYPLIVKKVLPEVVNGQFQVDFEFTAEQPTNITRGQAIQVKIELSDKTMVTRLPKGAFIDVTGGQWIFVVEGNNAYRRDIKVGRGNSEYYEVIDGLTKGERVIVSSYRNFNDKEQMIIQ